MSTELPTPFGLGEKPKQPGIKVQAVKFDELTHGPYAVEYGKKDNKLIFHFFKHGPFSLGFRSRLFKVFVAAFGLHGRENELLSIEWIPEFDSWCVIIPDLLSLSPPPSDQTIRQAVLAVLS